MSRKRRLKSDQAEALAEIEKMLNGPISDLEIENGNIVKLGLFDCKLYTFDEVYPKRIFFENERNEIPLTDIPEFKVDLKLNQLFDSIIKLEFLRTLSIERNIFLTIPEIIGDLTSLQKLYLSGNYLVTLPESIGNLKYLQYLNLSRNRLRFLPESIGNLKSLQTFNLENNRLEVLPDSIGNLKSLQTFNLEINRLETLPESFGDLASLKFLFLTENQLSNLPKSIGKLKSIEMLEIGSNKLLSLPKSIGNLKSLEILRLGKNRLASLPKTIGDLKSLKKLKLWANQLKTLPFSIWKLDKLTFLDLEANPWDIEWQDVVKRDLKSILNYCRQKETLSIFISHTVSEFKTYKIKDLALYLENQPEINQVYFCEEDLKGNIDDWMEDTVPKSHLLLFVGTQHSILSKDCIEEYRLARVNNIPVIPIRGKDVDWEDLATIGLNKEIGFEFDEKSFDIFCKELYKYVRDTYMEKNLEDKRDKIKENQEKIITKFSSFLKDRFFGVDISKIESLVQKIQTNEITFDEFLLKLADYYNY